MRRDVPRQELIDPIDRMFGDALEHVAQIRLRVDVVQLRGADERVDRSGACSASVGNQVQKVVLPPSWRGAALKNPADVRRRLLAIKYDARKMMTLVGKASARAGLKAWAPD